MQRNESTGWLDDVRHCPSPNFDTRPTACAIDLLVIHNISLPPAEFGGPYIEQFFCNCLDHSAHRYFEEIKDLQVSAHFLVRRDGEIVQFVSLFDRAWHAGVSSYQGRERCNDFSVGIELEGADDIPYCDAQYASLTTLTQLIAARCPGINPQAITGHSDIAPGRKTDPGPVFDWTRFLDSLMTGEG